MLFCKSFCLPKSKCDYAQSIILFRLTKLLPVGLAGQFDLDTVNVPKFFDCHKVLSGPVLSCVNRNSLIACSHHVTVFTSYVTNIVCLIMAKHMYSVIFMLCAKLHLEFGTFVSDFPVFFLQV